MPMIKSIFIVAMPGAGNLGDDIISSILVRKYQDKYPSAKIGILTNLEKNHFGYNSLNIVLFKKPRLLKPNYYVNKNKIKEFLKNTDMLIIGGGGLLQDTHFLFTSHRYIRYIFNTKPSCVKHLISVGVGPIKSRLTKLYLRFQLSLFDYIGLRDQESIYQIKNLGYKSVICPDVVMGCDIKEFFPSITESKGIGVSIRPWGQMDDSKMVNLIKNCFNRFKEPIYLFVFEYSKDNVLEYEYALNIQKILSVDKIESQIFVYNLSNNQTFLKAFRSVKYAIAVRFHANVLWQKLNVSTMPISYAPKVTSMYNKHDIKAFNFESYIPEKPSFFRLEIDDQFVLPDFLNAKKVTFLNKLIFIIYDIMDFIYKVCYSSLIRFKRFIN